MPKLFGGGFGVAAANGLPGMQTGIMADPRGPQRRTPLPRAFEFIPDRHDRKFPQRETVGYTIPIWGQTQYLSDGTPGGQPRPMPPGNIDQLKRVEMPRMNREDYKIFRQHREREIRAERFLAKASISRLAPLNKAKGADAAQSFRMKPPLYGKPLPPEPFVGGQSRVIERNRQYPRDTFVSMQPVRRNPWTSLPDFSGEAPSDARDARNPAIL